MKTRPDAMSQKAKFLGHRILRQSCHRWREVWRQRTFSRCPEVTPHNGLLFSQVSLMESQAPWHCPPMLDKKGLLQGVSLSRGLLCCWGIWMRLKH